MLEPPKEKDVTMNLGPLELIVILAVALLIFGPKNLPRLGKSLGQTVKNVREGIEDDDSKTEEAPKEPTKIEADAVEASSDEDIIDEAVRFCAKCGAKNAADAGFCSTCGEKLASAE